VQDITVEDDAAMLFGIAESCGLYQPSGMGINHTSWAEIKAWQESTGYCGLWLSESVMAISKAFVSAYNEYNDKPVSMSPLDPRTLDLLEIQRSKNA